MKLHSGVCLLTMVLVLSACSPMKFSQYSGNQAWTVGMEAMAETSFSLPVYRSFPDRPYEVLGSLRFTDPRKTWDDGVISAAVAAAKRHGADAIILRVGSEFGVSSGVGIAADPMLWQGQQTTALVIRWKSVETLRAEAARLLAFREAFTKTHSNLTVSPAAFDLGVEYGKKAGWEFNTTTTVAKMAQLLEGLRPPNQEDLQGKWLYKCTTIHSRITSKATDSFFGVASVTLSDDTLVIVSVSGPTEVNASGTFQNGRVNGKMGVSSTSLNCDGVASPEKISLSGQGYTAYGTVEASLILQR